MNSISPAPPHEVAPHTAADEKRLDDVTVQEAPWTDESRAEARATFSFKDSLRFKRRADVRLIPMFIAAYLIKNMDGNIISNVATMNQGTDRNVLVQLNMTSDTYSYLSTVFTISFALCEVPMNLLIKRFTPRLQFFRIIATWSIVVGCTAACQNAAGLFVCRFLLGVLEAGLWPGILYHMTTWYRPDECAVRLSCLSMLGQFSGIINAFIAYGLSFTSASTIAGWRWVYILLGILGLLISLVIFLWLPDYPDSPPSRRQFLTPEQGRFMASRLPPGGVSSHDLDFDWAAIRREFRSPLLYCFPLINLFSNTATTGIGFWLPTITAEFGLTGVTTSQLLNIGPSAIFVISAICTGVFHDRTVRFPKPLALIVAFLGMMGMLVGLVVSTSAPGRYVCILLSYMFNAMQFVTVWPLRAQTLRGSTQSAFVFAFTNTISNLAGLYSAQIFRKQYAPRYQLPFGICILFHGLGLITSCVTWYLMRGIEKETRDIAHARRCQGAENNTVAEFDVAHPDTFVNGGSKTTAERS